MASNESRETTNEKEGSVHKSHRLSSELNSQSASNAKAWSDLRARIYVLLITHYFFHSHIIEPDRQVFFRNVCQRHDDSLHARGRFELD